MIFEAFRRLQRSGVLGMNQRNAEYIMRCNARSSFPVVDDKVLTKRLAAEYQVPTPSLYHVVERYGDISRLERAIGDHRRFVVKPARGSGGSGILLITDKTADGFVKQTGEIVSWGEFAYHITDILSGIYSLSGLEDRAVFEALVLPDPVFASVTYEGVPDIRVVVYRGVPVMGMVRLPTQSSDGKANLHKGAVGAGVDMSKGVTLRGVHHTEVIAYHPDTGRFISDIRIPHWRKMLLMAASSFDMTGLCYLGVDMVIDREQGPLLLEMNARPGLAIQIANMSGLCGRFKRIDNASPVIFATPESRVTWAMETFAGSD